jgi:YD repeat-containing protein
MGARTLTYNQNNRLIQVAENSTTLGAYTYNGNGQRIKKVGAEATTIYHYDRFGNLIGESTPAGDFLADYMYLNNTRLAAIAAEEVQEIAVSVTTSAGRNLSGVPVYAFTEAGSYTGESAFTDEDGVALFELSAFSEGTYKFRADYLSYQFWSDVITLPGTFSAAIQIAEETTTVQMIQGGVAKEGVKVYLFNADGTYLGINGTTDENGEVTFDLPADKDFKFRADVLGSQFFSDIITIVSGGPNAYQIDTGGGTLSVTVDKGEGTPIAGISVYLFKGDGTSYLGLSDQTDEQGQASFEVCSGTYNVRADYLGYHFWSLEHAVTGDDSLLIPIPHQDVTMTVEGDNNADVEAREGLNVYLFTSAGSYLGEYHTTDAQGQVTFNLPEQDYKVRADYLSQQYWSEVFNWTDETITINEGEANVTMIHMGLPVEEVSIYVFNSAGAYLGLYDVTDVNGETPFRLPAGDYNFRGDFMGAHFWSGDSTLIPHVSNPITISAGGGAFVLTVLKGPDDPLEDVPCYLFSDSGAYLGEHEITSSEGEVTFHLADGTYKIRIDHLGYQFWTDPFTVPTTLSMTRTIAYWDVTVTVEGDYNGDVEARVGLNIYLFTPTGSYLGISQVTDAQGQVTFNLPEEDYKVRADFITQQYWSEVFNATDETITINEGMAEVHVTSGANPLENVPVYVFTALDAYLGINDQTDADGIVSFRLPEATYKFRADHLAEQYWAAEQVDAHQLNVINVDAGGGAFTLTVEQAAGVPMVGIPVYAFTSSGSYLSMTSQTDEQGQVSFDLQVQGGLSWIPVLEWCVHGAEHAFGCAHHRPSGCDHYGGEPVSDPC